MSISTNLGGRAYDDDDDDDDEDDGDEDDEMYGFDSDDFSGGSYEGKLLWSTEDDDGRSIDDDDAYDEEGEEVPVDGGVNHNRFNVMGLYPKYNEDPKFVTSIYFAKEQEARARIVQEQVQKEKQEERDKINRIRYQIEEYFDEDNLNRKSSYMHQVMDQGGYVPLMTLASFARVKQVIIRLIN